MRSIILMLTLILLGQAGYCQYTYTIKADSVKITNCDSAEFILENHTQGTKGFLYNKGNGRTEFRKGVVKLNDSLYLIGNDTIPVLSSKMAWLLNGNSGINPDSQFLGTIDTANLIVKTNNLERARIHGSNGNLLVGSTTDDGNQLQVYGNASFNQSRLVIGSEGYAGTPSFHSTSYLTQKSDANIFIFQGTGSNYMSFQLVGPNATTVVPYCGAINGFNYNSAAGNNQPLLITTSGWSASTTNHAGDIVLRPGTDFSNGNLAQFTNDNILMQPAGAGVVKITNDAGNARLGVGLAPTAKLHIAAGTATAGTSPLKLTTGTILTTPEDGSIEYDGTDIYFTNSTARYKLVKTLTGQTTTSFGGGTITAFNNVTTTLTVTGAQSGDVVAVNANSGAVLSPAIIITAYVTSTDTVTLQAYNASSSSVSLASQTYNVRILK
jgi:hypothetical protein